MKRIGLILLMLLIIPVKSQEFTLELFAQGFDSPVEAAHAGDSRLFIVEQTGKIKILNEDGTVNSTPFLDLSSLVSTGGERGLLGLAFAPDYENSSRFYVNYTNISGNTVIACYTVSSNPDIADPDGNILLTYNQPYSNHNGGTLKFGPDGYLWISSGDGGSGGDPHDNGQNTDVLLGKILRIDVSGETYTIPADNPFADGSGAEEILHYGLRNPWKFSFDRLTDELWIADVGQNQFEEINKQDWNDLGMNFGWRCYEGNEPYNTSGCDSADTMVFPIAIYTHSQGRCSLTGGYVYRGDNFPNLQEKYFFGDYCTGDIGWVDGTNLEFLYKEQGLFITSFAEDVNGELYVLGSGKVYKIIGEAMNIKEEKSTGLKIYPNPTEDLIYITGEVSGSQIKLLSGDGRLIRSFSNTPDNISLKDYPNGIYLLLAEDKNRSQTYKIIKK